MIATLLLSALAQADAQPIPQTAAAPEALARPTQDDHKKEYDRRRKEAGKDVEALWELHLWCDAYSMGKESRSCLRAILKLDDAHRGAHEGLGHVYHDGQWFKSERELEKYKKAEAKRIAKEQGLVEYEGEWVPADDVPFLERGMVRGDDGRWITQEEFEKLAAGWVRQDLVWVSPDEIENVEKGLWKCGDRWLELAEADRYHAYLERWWIIPTPRFVLHTTCDRAVAEQAIEVMDRAYRDLVRVFGVAPSHELPVVLARDLRQYSAFTAGDEGITPPAEASGFSSLHHACFADLWRAEALPESYGAGTGYWDAGSEEASAFGPFAARDAAGLSFVEALDPSPKAVERMLAKDRADDADVAAFWGEKALPEWLRQGAASYAERYYVDNLVDRGGNTAWVREWSVDNLQLRGGLRPLREVFEARVTLDDPPGSEKLLNERGLVVAFILDGACEPVTSAHEEFKAALAEGKDLDRPLSKLKKQLLAHEDQLRTFAGI